MKNNKKSGIGSLTLRERIEIKHKYRYGEAIPKYCEIDGRPRIDRSRYQADLTHRQALTRIAKRGNISILEYNEELYKYIFEKLKLGWSPEQVSVRLPIDFVDDELMRISHESIYTYI